MAAISLVLRIQWSGTKQRFEVARFLTALRLSSKVGFGEAARQHWTNWPRSAMGRTRLKWQSRRVALQILLSTQSRRSSGSAGVECLIIGLGLVFGGMIGGISIFCMIITYLIQLIKGQMWVRVGHHLY